ncbi:hypothetical protein K7X08_016639 [Anisodus acutangulus]|uniref:Uncharacterized protein n=1 Tax=Anisodus acutangulus TaxID=402998 RepID=A0A9Q1LEJ4_9SOLA|nr:hypothetical protein K7X08_016639 [Anisodus acutangulus]
MALHTKSNPLFSSIITLYTLILLYFPNNFRAILFSLVFLSTSLLILFLLRLSATQKTKHEKTEKSFPTSPSQILHGNYYSCKWVSRESHVGPTTTFGPDPDYDFDPDPTRVVSDPDPFYGESFVEWNVGVPLEVIHEEDNEDEEGMRVIERCASLSLYYPETDTVTDSSSVLDSPVIGKLD